VKPEPLWRRALDARELEQFTPRRAQGFAVMPVELRQEIASKGGKASQERGTGHRLTVEEAREVGRKGGLAKHRTRGPAPSC
jgi:general stress protein YciG